MKKQAVFLLCLAVIFSSATAFSSLKFGKGKVAIIDLEGTIKPTSDPSAFSSGGVITPDKLRDLNSRAKEKNADAIIYEINSGGGAVVASKEVKREIESVNMPTVCRFRDVAASGAYLASLGCDRIVADSASITGSIGVKSSYLEFSDLLEKYGIDYVNITSGKHKDVGSTYSEPTETDIKILKNKTDKIHSQFVEEVAEERNLTEGQRKKIRTGKIFLGSRARELGLVDKLGGRDTAVRTAENLTDRSLKPETIKSDPGLGIFSMLASSPLKNLLNRQTLLKAEWR